jgi:Na+-transporting NADH:ubiquinone oxidoreductase subunit NqrC
MMEANDLARILLVISAMCVVIAVGLVIATAYLLLKARQQLHRLKREPQVVRDRYIFERSNSSKN